MSKLEKEYKLFKALFESPSEERLLSLIEEGNIGSTSFLPNAFDHYSLSLVCYMLSRSDIVKPEYKERFARMTEIANIACDLEKELDHDTLDAAFERLKSPKPSFTP